MPIYSVKCHCCGKKQDIYRSIAQYEELPECCGQSTQRQITAPQIMTDIAPYKSMITGEMITSRSQHRSHLKQHGMVEVGNEKMPAPKQMDDVGGLKEELYARVSG